MERAYLPDLPLPHSLTTMRLIESLLFIAGEAVTIGQLAKTLEVSIDVVEDGLALLAAACQERGIRVQRAGDSVCFVSAPESAVVVERFLGVQVAPRLSSAALEVLAIVAYRQPITRAQVEAIRGVDSSGVIRALLGRDLIVEAGRVDSVGRPILYATTPEFLRSFGLGSLADLPPLELPEKPISGNGSGER